MLASQLNKNEKLAAAITFVREKTMGFLKEAQNLPTITYSDCAKKLNREAVAQQIRT